MRAPSCVTSSNASVSCAINFCPCRHRWLAIQQSHLSHVTPPSRTIWMRYCPPFRMSFRWTWKTRDLRRVARTGAEIRIYPSLPDSLWATGTSAWYQEPFRRAPARRGPNVRERRGIVSARFTAGSSAATLSAITQKLRLRNERLLARREERAPGRGEIKPLSWVLPSSQQHV